MLIDTEKWEEIFKTLGKHKLRTALTGLGVFWGIFMLTLLLGGVKSFENGVKSRFPAVPNVVFMWIKGSTQMPYQGMSVGRWVGLKAEDVALIEKNVASVGSIRGQNSVGIWNGTPPYTKYKNKNGAFSVQGSHSGMEPLQYVSILQGRGFNDTDNIERRKVAIIGKRVRAQLFAEDEDPVGKSIQVNGISFTVIAVFESLNSNNKQMDEEKIYLPNDTLRYSFNQMGWIGNLVIIPTQGIHAEVTEADVKRYLSELKKVHPEDSGIFGSFNMQIEYDKIDGLFTGMTFFSWVVAVGTILAGAIGVGNIMLIVVKERTREIGLRKALGATPGSIVGMIIQESLFITAIAGYAGLVAGVFLLEGFEAIRSSAGGDTGFFGKPEVDFQTALTALTVLILAGLFASILPASKAAAVNPIVALQDE